MPDFNEVSDYLNLSSALRRAARHRVEFDPTNPEHIDSLKNFMRTGNWGSVQFYCEHPYTDVPMTVFMKYIHFTLDTSRETTEEQRKRFESMNLIQINKEPDTLPL